MPLTTVGNVAGKLCFTFSDPAGEDSGAISFLETPSGYKARTFQLLTSSDASGFQITVWGTLDVNTASGMGTAWDEIPAPSTESAPVWSNPMSETAGTRLFFCGAPLVAVRFTNAANVGLTGTATVLMLAAA